MPNTGHALTLVVSVVSLALRVTLVAVSPDFFAFGNALLFLASSITDIISGVLIISLRMCEFAHANLTVIRYERYESQIFRDIRISISFTPVHR